MYVYIIHIPPFPEEFYLTHLYIYIVLFTDVLNLIVKKKLVRPVSTFIIYPKNIVPV
jgi:hypothetical protein